MIAQRYLALLFDPQQMQNEFATIDVSTEEELEMVVKVGTREGKKGGRVGGRGVVIPGVSAVVVDACFLSRVFCCVVPVAAGRPDANHTCFTAANPHTLFF